ncbi:hypothetical protein [Knoellia remsis]|nr:hypothetical protein [Knoellia remsis]
MDTSQTNPTGSTAQTTTRQADARILALMPALMLIPVGLVLAVVFGPKVTDTSRAAWGVAAIVICAVGGGIIAGLVARAKKQGRA